MAKKINFQSLGKVVTAEVTNLSELEYKAFAFDLFGEIIRFTPVKSGRARGNWHIDAERPDYEITDSTLPATPDYGLDVRGFPNVYISNGLPYMGKLESGSSPQAPNGITSVALAAVRSRR